MEEGGKGGEGTNSMSVSPPVVLERRATKDEGEADATEAAGGLSPVLSVPESSEEDIFRARGTQLC